MANSYTHMSAFLQLPREALDIIAAINDAMNNDEPLPTALTGGERAMLDDTAAPYLGRCEWDDVEGKIWLHGDTVRVESVAALVQIAIHRFQPALKWGFEWAYTCSRPRPGEFGGGAAVVAADAIEWCCTSDWLREMARR
jgi:hypothetical protein